ncbi:hypothetical protein A0H76_2846 [Hepatospora eriocheir]|uniref:Transmembrane protein n=1 Tax=Hepatospora eriocheir TaxID=1081669 RepID=A0A1X0Q5S9_9MICR|nr:hypothetical protein A0H76_2846 [Hepatospora eriocheir]
MSYNYQQQNDQAFNLNNILDKSDNKTLYNPAYNNNQPNDNQMSYQNSNNQMQQPFEYNNQAFNPNNVPNSLDNKTLYNPDYNNNQSNDNQMSYQNPYNQMQQPPESNNNDGFSQNDPSCKEKDEKSTSSSFWGSIFSIEFLIYSLIVVAIVFYLFPVPKEKFNLTKLIPQYLFFLLALIILILCIKLIISWIFCPPH